MTQRLPARIIGGYRTGKTTALREASDRFDRPLNICASVAACAAFGRPAVTFWDVAVDVLARHGRPVRVLSTAEQCARVGDADLADAVSHYTASFLGREELRTHALAAGVYEQWEKVADAAERVGAENQHDGVADWATVLVEASLLLRDDDVLAAERARFDAIVVDDYEAASFASNRLLSQLAGYGGPVVVAGNPDNPVWRHVAASTAYLERFARRFGAAEDVRLDGAHAGHGEGEVDLLVGPGGDPWLPRPDGEPVPVALASSLSWETARLVDGAARGGDGPYDVEVLAGPDVPSAEQRAARRSREDEARWALARSRAAQTTVQPPST